MASGKGNRPEFEYFDANTADPVGKYAQPKPNTNSTGKQVDTGYPDLDTGWDDVRVKGRYMSGTKKKQYADMRGFGAATKGKKFLLDSED
jgi:hypothetical protein